MTPQKAIRALFGSLGVKGPGALEKLVHPKCWLVRRIGQDQKSNCDFDH